MYGKLDSHTPLMLECTTVYVNHIQEHQIITIIEEKLLDSDRIDMSFFLIVKYNNIKYILHLKSVRHS
jgi:hypothetical protein